MCLTWRSPGLALMARWCLYILQGILRHCLLPAEMGVNKNSAGSAATSDPGTPAVTHPHGCTPGVAPRPSPAGDLVPA